MLLHLAKVFLGGVDLSTVCVCVCVCVCVFGSDVGGDGKKEVTTSHTRHPHSSMFPWATSIAHLLLLLLPQRTHPLVSSASFLFPSSSEEHNKFLLLSHL